jgi:fumarate hydratase subunit beta
MSIVVKTPLSDEVAKSLRVGNRVLISGVIYTARDAAHKRLVALLQAEEQLPVELEGQIIYYAGPCPARPGQVIGSVGPTTSGRMDAYTPALLDKGLAGMIGKGQRAKSVVDSIIKNGAVYFAAIGGAGALLASSVRETTVVAFPELGAEAIYRLTVEDFPAIVVIDSRGGNLYISGRESYRRVVENDI